MKFIFPALFHKENDSYWVEFPDLNGCNTYGSSLQEAMSSAEEALGAYILTFFDEDLKLPPASDIRSIPDPEDGFVSLVSASIDPYKDTKAVKKTLTIPSWLNERATKLNINFSQTLQDALLKKIYSA